MKNFEITAIILAAGSSKRMGIDNKLLRVWQGKPLLAHACHAAIKSQCKSTIVVTGHEENQILKAIDNFEVTFCHNVDFVTGMASSIKTGLRTADQQNCDGVIIMLGDMPKISSTMINQLITAGKNSGDQAIIAPASDGKRGNPLLWKKHYFDRLLEIEGDQGARQIIREFEDKVIEIDLGHQSRFDLDTPQAFEENRDW